MADVATRSASNSKLDPSTAWTAVTDLPLKGLSLAREAGRLLAWDEGGQVSIYGVDGELQATTRMPETIIAGAISDDGSLIALVGAGQRLWLLDRALERTTDRGTVPDPSCLAIDPHGRYVAVASKINITQIYNRYGKHAGKFETRQPLAHLLFVPDRPFLMGTAAYGTIAGIDLGVRGGKLDPEVQWQENLTSNVGRLACTGDGSMILAACYTHGIQRYDLRGHNDGSYHLGGSTSHAVPDFAGTLIAVTTLENELAVLSAGGAVRWRTELPRAANALAVDALGSYLIYGLPTGEIVRLDLRGGIKSDVGMGEPGTDERPAAAPAVRAGGGSVRRPDWLEPVVPTVEMAEFAVVAVVDDPLRIGVISPQNKLQLYDAAGHKLGQAPEIHGVGRILRSSKGWIAAATDRNLVLCDLVANTARRIDLDLVEVTHLAIDPDDFGLAIVQERDRIGRATPAGRWIWKHELKSAVEDLAVGVGGECAISTDNGRVTVYDAAGEPAGVYASAPSEPLFLLAAPDGSPDGTAWLTLARRAQVARGHDRIGKVLWELPVPWEAWSFQKLGAIALALAPDGRALAIDGSGRVRGQSRAAGTNRDVFQVGADGQVHRVTAQGVHLICSDLKGQVRWRAVTDAPIGPISAGRGGVAVMLGRSLAWFGVT
ncbi:hypothetical protein EP7_001124 [Isosphaeraceae bacterium EP7]